MQLKFINFIYFERRILAFTEEGDCWEFEYVHPTIESKWRFISYGPKNDK